MYAVVCDGVLCTALCTIRPDKSVCQHCWKLHLGLEKMTIRALCSGFRVSQCSVVSYTWPKYPFHHTSSLTPGAGLEAPLRRSPPSRVHVSHPSRSIHVQGIYCAAMLEMVLQSALIVLGHRPKRFRKRGSVLATKPRAPASMVVSSVAQPRSLAWQLRSKYLACVRPWAA